MSPYPTKHAFLPPSPQDCPICKDPLITAAPTTSPHAHPSLKLTTCGHVFGKACLETWLRDHNTCPMCRATLFAFGLGRSCSQIDSQISSQLSSTISDLEAMQETIHALDARLERLDVMLERSIRAGEPLNARLERSLRAGEQLDATLERSNRTSEQ
ncbi:hypothetical protein K458DRAFT_409016 [Lentithecium fluviatile CBS 122367]|uniref:RING-type domain-containing protein n=1 Tax=Lentithecium fluviatile CBS 122367 TaxID=1168545 RepID=A0A6G1IJU8_9PLEO|nr:hypothetical protein K458DRAFT_409016 [Lentithecium fluviatile CBS 122367]